MKPRYFRALQKDTLEYECNDNHDLIVYAVLGEQCEPPINPRTKVPKDSILLFKFDDGHNILCKYKETNLHSTAALSYHIFEDEKFNLRIIVDQAKEN